MKRSRRKMKKTTKQYIIVCMIALFVTAISATVITLRIINNITTASNKKVEEYKTEMERNKREVYIAKEGIRKGEALTEDKVKREYVFATQPQETYITSEDIGKKTVIDIDAGTQILKSMLTENFIEDNLREVEFNSIVITSNVSDNDFVDIRIVFPNGEDFTILSKKNIKGYEEGSLKCLLWINEEELLRMQSAIVDAYLYEGAYIYTTKYIEPTLQSAIVPNYEPKIEVINLIKENPNIIQEATYKMSIVARKALENRLADTIEKNISTKWQDIDNDYVYSEYDTENEDYIEENKNEENLINEIEDENKDITKELGQEKIYDNDNFDKENDTQETYFPELGKA